MDQLQISPETQQGLQNLSAKDKQELNQFVIGETQKAQLQSSTRVFLSFSSRDYSLQSLRNAACPLHLTLSLLQATGVRAFDGHLYTISH